MTELAPTQRILQEVSYGDDPSDLDVFIVRYHINSTDEVQSVPVDLSRVKYKNWRAAVEAALPKDEPVIAWHVLEAEFEHAPYPPDSGWYVPSEAECILES